MKLSSASSSLVAIGGWLLVGGARADIDGPEVKWYQNAPDIQGVDESQDGFGQALAIGDFNADGRDDLAVGVPGEDYEGEIDNGIVQVLWGAPTGAIGLIAAGNVLLEPQLLGYVAFGAALAVGDFLECDGIDDLLIGAPLTAGGGRVLGYKGSPTGLELAFNSLSPPGGGRFGQALAIGDFDGDGCEDLAVGIPEAPHGTHPFQFPAGSVALFDHAGGFTLWHQDSVGVLGLPEVGDQFGFSLAAGDFNGDGIDDLAIGIPGEEVSGFAGAGGVQILVGSAGGLVVGGFWSQNSGTVLGGAEAGDRFGHALAAGDFDSDGKDDLAVGASQEDIGAAIDTGAVHMLRGSATGVTDTDNQLFLQDDIVSGVSSSGDRFGHALAAGDVDGASPSFDDLAIGAPGENLDGGPENEGQGTVLVLHGRASGLGHPADWLSSRDGVAPRGGADYGAALAIGELGQSAGAELVIGAPGDNDPPNDIAGLAVVFSVPYVPGTIFELTVVRVGNGTVASADGSIACGATCQANYDPGTPVTLSAIPDAGWEFTSWSSLGCPGVGDCLFHMTADRTLIATFTILRYDLSVAAQGAGAGSVTGSGLDCGIGGVGGSDCGEEYDHGTEVTLTANPGPQSVFRGWNGDCAGTGECTVNMDQARSVAAQFEPKHLFSDGFESGDTGGWS